MPACADDGLKRAEEGGLRCSGPQSFAAKSPLRDLYCSVLRCPQAPGSLHPEELLSDFVCCRQDVAKVPKATNIATYPAQEVAVWPCTKARRPFSKPACSVEGANLQRAKPVLRLRVRSRSGVQSSVFGPGLQRALQRTGREEPGRQAQRGNGEAQRSKKYAGLLPAHPWENYRPNTVSSKPADARASMPALDDTMLPVRPRGMVFGNLNQLPPRSGLPTSLH